MFCILHRQVEKMVQDTTIYMEKIFNHSSEQGQNDYVNSTMLYSNITQEDTQNFRFKDVSKNEDVESEVIIWAFIDGFLFLAIICGNILTIYAIILSKTMSKIISNRFILSLAISDLLVGLMVFYHMMFYIQPELGDLFGFCIVRLALISLACSASICNILGIAIDRYTAVVYPLHYNKIITERTARLISIFGWLLAFILATVPTYWNDWNDSRNSHGKCEMGRIVHPLYVMTMYVPAFIVLYTGMCVFYLKIIRETRKHARRMNQLTNDKHFPWKSIQVLTMVMGSFTISYMPFIIVVIVNSIFQRRTKTISTIYKITYSLAVANSAVNPLIYAWKNQELKKTLCSIIYCKSINSSGEII